MDWNRMSKRQQDAARNLARGPLADIPAASVSQVAKYFDEVMDYARRDGRHYLIADLAGLCNEVGWAMPAPATREITARELAAQLGVSLTTAYRRIRAGLVQAVKNTAGRWVVTVPAA